MQALTETKQQSPHEKIKTQIANDYRAKGYVVTTEKCIGNRRVDIYAENDKEALIIEVVDTHYSGPLNEKLLTQLKVTIANGWTKTGKKRKTTSLSINAKLWETWKIYSKVKGYSASKMLEIAITEEMKNHPIK